jgi:N-acylneuraminate cytidylyltransferase
VGRAAGFEVIKRPAELATATSATDPVLRHAVGEIYEKPGAGGEKPEARSQKPEVVVMLYGNVPVRMGNMIDRCVEMLLETGCDSVQTVAGVGKMHPYWMFEMGANGRIQKYVPNNVFRRQDLPILHSPTGAVYAMRAEVLMAAEGASDPHAFLGNDRRGIEFLPESSVDIDSAKDLYLAEAVLRSIIEPWQQVAPQLLALQLPSWVHDVARMPMFDAILSPGFNLEQSAVTESYLDFLRGEIKLESRGPEWAVMMRRRLEALLPKVGRRLWILHLGKQMEVSVYMDDSLQVIYSEMH